MIATMPPTFSVQAAQATITGAAGSIDVKGDGRSALLVRGQLRGQGGNVVVHIPVSLAANTRSFVVQAVMEGRGTAYLTGPGLITRRVPLQGQAYLAMGATGSRGRAFFTLDQVLHTTLEIVLNDLEPGQSSNFSIRLEMRDLGY